VLQKWSKKFFFEDLPGVRILLWPSRILGSAPEALPSLTTLIDPQRGIGATANALGPFKSDPVPWDTELARMTVTKEAGHGNEAEETCDIAGAVQSLERD
jgi:hypothetical protein